MDELWEEVWLELREALMNQPRCPDHPEYPCVRTLDQEVINDIVRVGADGIVVRSHRTGRENPIEAERFRAWWEHLQRHGTASLVPGGDNNLHRWRSCVVGAIWARCLPERVRWHPTSPSEIQLADHAQIEQLAERSVTSGQVGSVTPAQAWEAEWRAWAAGHKALPSAADDDRDSIYAGRGE